MIDRRSVVALALGGAMGLCGARGAVAADTRRRRAVSGDEFIFDGEEIILDDIIAPSQASLMREAPGVASAARDALDRLIASGDLDIRETRERDRWNRVVAHVTRVGSDAPLGVQGALVAAGHARVHPGSKDHAFISGLYDLEKEARDARRGLWSHRIYSVFDASDANASVGGFSLVEGTVLECADAGGRTYLNFGENYKTDFTASVRSAVARRWAKNGPIDLMTLQGAHLRIRGFVEWINGPSIELRHPLQIEVLTPPGDAAA